VIRTHGGVGGRGREASSHPDSADKFIMEPSMNRTEIADLIVNRLKSEIGALSSMYQASMPKIGYFFVDDLLPEDVAKGIFSCFPDEKDMQLKKSIREYKYVAAQMNSYNPVLEEAVYAFQDQRVVELISKICKIKSLYPDERLYAGGISLMGNKHFLNPHLDNSHDKDRDRWRVLNLLYYVTPDWSVTNGGNLELWPDGLQKEQILIHSKFNRLAVLATHDSSWHSVSPITCEKNARCCVSNYYFSDSSLKGSEIFHITSFRGRPGQKIRDIVLQADIGLRTALRKVFKKGIVENKHVYRK
jgi:Rps23 Pro-64 3,4-dihydroxylase Tpa1-like proline 4-hydroxylase